MTVEEKQLLLAVKSLILDFGERFKEKDKCVQIIQHIEDGLNQSNLHENTR